MLISGNQIKRKGITFLLISALLTTGLFSCQNVAYADDMILSDEIYYHLDMGVQIAYNEGCFWGSEHIYNSSTPIPVNTTITFNYDVEVIDTYPLNSSKGDSFDFNGETSSHNIPQELGDGTSAYNWLYKDYISSSMTEGSCDSSNSKVIFSYTAKLNTVEPLEVVSYGRDGKDNAVYQLFGGKAALEADQPEIAEAIKTALEAGRNGTAGTNKLYLIFCPNVIAYKKYITVGDLEAKLDLPRSAKQGETYTASDASHIDSSLTVENAVLEKQGSTGAWERVATWEGPGIPGRNTNGSAEETCSEVGPVTYRLTVETTNGQTDTDIQTIQITDGRDIDGQAILELPEYTYEGHPALARDVSVFSVDGISYSARRAYEEGVAENGFYPLPASAGSVERESLTTSNITFPESGNYSVRLQVDTASGNTLSDTKPITVRKTPYILDSLGGFQKENRKQILGVSVATYPGKPVIDYYIKLKDLETGQEITLTKDRPQQNNETIKTRTVTSGGDTYWTNYELQFLTKNTAGQLYQYTIYMKDSKGDTDTVQKTFAVKPDLPPDPAIIMQDSFIRNKGTNHTEITAEDASTTDGDQLERTWSLEGKNIKTLAGYKDLSFGTGQKVQFNKTGVGKADVRLDLKDVWIEPTLEEYVTDADHKTAAGTKTTDVINIAPTVRLEAKNTKETDIVIVTDKKNKTQIGASINTLKAALMEKGFDPHISLAVAADAYNDAYRKVASWTWSTTVNCLMCNQNHGQMDSDYVYRITSPGKYVDGYQERCVTNLPHVLEALTAGTTADSGRIAWSYPVNESRSFAFYLDNKEKYVYISCSDINRTIILNRDNGAYLTTLNMAIPGTPFLNDDGQNLYFVGGSSITKFDTLSGTYSTVMSRGGALAQMMDGKVVFVGKKEAAVRLNKNGVGFYIGKFNINTETIEEIAIPELPDTSGVVSVFDIDMRGKVLFKQGSNLWVADTQKQTVKMTGGVRTRTQNDENYSESAAFVKNEKGEGTYVAFSCFSAYLQNGWKYKGEFTLYDFAGQDSLVSKTSWSKSYSYYNLSGISYAKLHSKENKIYILIGNQFQGNDWGGNTEGMLFRISLPSFSIDTAMNGWGWDNADESGAYNGSLMRTFYALDRWTGMEDRINIFRNPITEQDAKTFALRQNAQSEYGNSEKYVIVAGDDAAAQILNNQDFKNEIDLRGFRSLFYNMKDSIASIADRIDDLGDSLQNFLMLEGDNIANRASAEHDFQLRPNTEYEYQYNVATTGKAVDLFSVKNPNSKGLEHDGKYFEKTAAIVNFNHGIPEPFFSMSGGSTYAPAYDTPGGYGNYTERNITAAFATSFTMEKEGYVSFDLWIGDPTYKEFVNTVTMYLNGTLIGSDGVGGRNTKLTSKIIYLSPGTYALSFNHYAEATVGGAIVTINNLKAVYYEDTTDGFAPATIPSSNNGKTITVSNSFRVAGQESMEVLKDQTKTMVTMSGTEYSKYISSESYYYRDIYERRLTGYDKKGRPIYENVYVGTARENLYPFSFDEETKVYSISLNSEKAYMSFSITAPSDKFLVYSYNLSYAGGRITDTSQQGERLSPGTEVRILRPGQTQTLSATMSTYSYIYDKIPKAYVSNIRIAEFDASDFGGAAALQSMVINTENGTVLMPSGSESLLAKINSSQNQVSMKRIKDMGDTGAPLNNGIRLSTSESSGRISALVSNFSLFQKIGGIKQLIFSQDFNSQNALDLTGWHLLTAGGGKAEIVSVKQPVKEEDAPLVYKKGQLVAYNIFYDDYENDPSQKQFWRYTHTPYNDGPHPQAAFILDEEGNVASSTGMILAQSIPRFYVDGKYTVEHWQLDNTNRTGDTSGKVDYGKYDKLSNIETITFYIEGGATAPWITSIKTIPGTVKEGGSYLLQIGVDDAEKDELRLTTELYMNKKLIYTHRQTGITADSKGNYPLTTTGNPPLAAAGKYEVVCTVRDQSGAGIGTYKFTVVSEGKITGAVGHTPQWDENRKKYNLKRFSDEINRTSVFDDYMTDPMPRQRGSNVFWSGEKFMLSAETEGNPTHISVRIKDKDPSGGFRNTEYMAELSRAGTGSEGAERWQGSLWDRTMINKWGRKEPEELLFEFTAQYEGGTVRTSQVRVIIDSDCDYWQLHRLW